MMRYFLCSILLVTTACASDYAGMRRVDPPCDMNALRPVPMETTLFNASVDVMGRHMSGLLFVKNLPDGVHRVLFTSETGVTFFDFEYGANGKFVVHRVVPQMDKKVVINLLRSDLALLVARPFQATRLEFFTLNDSLFAGVDQKKETAYFITDKDCASLQRFEVGSDRKRKVTVTFDGETSAPDAVEIRHHTFDMRIRLRKLNRE